MSHASVLLHLFQEIIGIGSGWSRSHKDLIAGPPLHLTYHGSFVQIPDNQLYVGKCERFRAHFFITDPTLSPLQFPYHGGEI